MLPGGELVAFHFKLCGMFTQIAFIFIAR